MNGSDRPIVRGNIGVIKDLHEQVSYLRDLLHRIVELGEGMEKNDEIMAEVGRHAQTLAKIGLDRCRGD